MRVTLPPQALDLLSAVATDLGKRKGSQNGGDAWHVIGLPLWHPTVNAMAVTIRHSIRTWKSVPSLSGAWKTQPQHESYRRQWKVARVQYLIYTLDLRNNVITQHGDTVSDLLTIKREFRELAKHWALQA